MMSRHLNVFQKQLNRCRCVVLISTLLLGGLALVTLAQAQDEPRDSAEKRADEAHEKANETTIRADSVDMNFNEHQAIFSGNVQVSDGEMVLTADRMVVHLSAENELRKIVATGNVLIVNPEQDRRATAGRAEYDVETGAIELTEKPHLEMGENRLENAAKITYFRDTGRVTTEGGTITFKPGEKGGNTDFLGKDGKNDQQ